MSTIVFQDTKGESINNPDLVYLRLEALNLSPDIRRRPMGATTSIDFIDKGLRKHSLIILPDKRFGFI